MNFEKNMLFETWMANKMGEKIKYIALDMHCICTFLAYKKFDINCQQTTPYTFNTNLQYVMKKSGFSSEGKENPRK